MLLKENYFQIYIKLVEAEILNFSKICQNSIRTASYENLYSQTSFALTLSLFLQNQFQNCRFRIGKVKLLDK